MADMVFQGGVVLTMREELPRVEALAVRGGRILALGSRREVLELRRRHTEVVDLGGACLLPGFHDSHLHLGQHGFELAQLDLRNSADEEQALELVAASVKSIPPGEWILGSGFSLPRWGVTGVHKRALDRVAPRHPVLLRSQDHHSGWANSLALELASIAVGTPDPPDGVIVRDDAGEATGLLLERAVGLVRDRLPAPGREAIRMALLRAAERLAGCGITTVHHMAYEPADSWRELASLASRADFPIRVWACIPQEEIEQAAAIGLATGQGGDNFMIGGAKFFADGALGSRTAWMLEPYQGTTDTGMAIAGPEVLARRYPLAIAAGLTPVTHAIGDRANRVVLDALEATRSAWRARGLRPRLEHAQHLHPAEVKRAGALGLICSMQPIHLTFDAPNIRVSLGDRLERAYPMRSLLASGALLAFGSDTPVASPEVAAGLRAACWRRDTAGEVLGGGEALTPAQALRAYTRDAAFAIGQEGRSGRLAVGFDADLVVTSHDPTRELEGLEILATVKAGRWTFRS